MSIASQVSHGLRGLVLSVDDNPINQMLLSAVFANCPGVELMQADTGWGGLAMAVERTPDLILLDVRLPDIGGLDLLRELQADPRTQGTPVAMLSADDEPRDVREARELGARAYLRKPFELDEFFAQMSVLLQATAAPR